MVIKLKDLGEIITGNTPSKKEISFWDSEDIRFVKPDIISDIGISKIEATSEYLSENARSKARIVKKDTIFVTCIGSIGKVGIASEGDYAFNQQINAIVPNKQIVARYLAYALLQAKPRLEAIANAPVVPIINKSQFREFQINIERDRTKQQKVVEKLDLLDEIISKRKKEIVMLDELIKARFVEMFGDPVSNAFEWKTALLREVTSKIGSGATPRGGKESYQAEGITLIRSMNVHDGRFEYKDLAHITDEQASQLDNVTVEEGDVFINITGASVARSCIVPKDTLPARVNQHVAIIRCIHGLLNPTFVNNMFLNDRFKGQLLDIGESGGATRQAITKQQLENLTVVLPPLELQEQFAVFVAQVDKSKVAVQKALDEAQVLFDSLMQQYFG